MIGDYGCACDLTLESDRLFKNGHFATRAPEIAEMRYGEKINEDILAADIYSMGKILEKMFSSHSIDSLNQLITNMLKNNPSERPNAQTVYNRFCEYSKTFY